MSHEHPSVTVAPPPGVIAPSSNVVLFTKGLDQSGTPLILLTASGLVEHVVPAARAMMQQSPVLQIRESRLHLRRAGERRMLQQALARVPLAGLGAPDDTNLVMLRNREERAVMALLLAPVSHALLPPFVLVRIANLLTPFEAPSPLLARVFDLTPAEARISLGLLDGLDLKAIAQRHETALETVRGHLKRAMAKTTAHSQAQFVRLLLHTYGSLVIPVLEE